MKDLTEGNIYKTFLLFAAPLILAGFLSQAYSIIDTVIAGRILSTRGLAAIGSTSAFIQFFSSVFWGYGVGFSIYLARLFGAGEFEKLKTAVYVNCSLMALATVILSVLSVLFKDELFLILSVDESVKEGAGTYFSVYMAGIVFILMSNNGVYIMNAFGSGAYPLAMSVLSTVLHISGNLFAVRVLNLGIGGIAASAVLSALIVDVCYFFRIRKYFEKMGVAKHRVKFSLAPVSESVKYSVTTMIQQMFMYFSSLAVSPLVNGIGGAASAAYVIVLKVYDINATVYQNSSKTLSNYEAQSIGAGKFGNVKKGLFVGLLQGLFFEVPVLLLTVVFANRLCLLFLPSGGGGESVKMAVVFARYYMPFILFNLINNLFHAFYRGVGSMACLLEATFIGSAARIIATYIAAGYFAMDGVYIGWAVSWAVECLFCLFVYFSGRWKPKELKILKKVDSLTLGRYNGK